MKRTCVVLGLLAAGVASGHEGPPFPILNDATAGPYRVSIWTDPDVSEDPQASLGRFWVLVHGAADGKAAGDARVTVSVEAAAPPEARASAVATRDASEASRYLSVLRLAREGRFTVTATVVGPTGTATVMAPVDATYDTRPARGMMLVFLMPFVLVGGLWVLALRRRRRLQPTR